MQIDQLALAQRALAATKSKSQRKRSLRQVHQSIIRLRKQLAQEYHHLMQTHSLNYRNAYDRQQQQISHHQQVLNTMSDNPTVINYTRS